MSGADKHHPVFSHFRPFVGEIPEGFEVDFIGSKKRLEFWRGREVRLGYPPVDQMYFEWIAVLEAVLQARDRFEMIELGSGWGEWSVRAAMAVRQLSAMPVHLTAVEADPIHFEWVQLHFLDNGIDPAAHTLIRAAVCGNSEARPFLVGSPHGNDAPHEWYGQALATWAGAVVEEHAGFHGGFPVRLHESGWRSIETARITLREILKDRTRVDLIHMDAQGVEYEVLAAAIDEVDSMVKRTCIATHSREIDGELKRLLGGHGWECAMAYPCEDASETAWGRVEFVDGLQVWTNPRLMGP